MLYTKRQIVVLPIMFVMMLAISIICGKLMKNKSDKIRKMPIFIIATVLLILEVIKQIDCIVNDEWSYWKLPLHFCSALMLWYAIASYSKNKTFEQVGLLLSFSTSLVMCVILYINPYSIIGSNSGFPFDSFASFHNFFFHILAMSVWMFILTCNLLKPTWKILGISMILLFIYYIIVIISAFALNTNFVSVLTSIIGFMENFRIENGQVLYLIVMLIFGLGTIFIINFLCLLFYDNLQRRKNND